MLILCFLLIFMIFNFSNLFNLRSFVKNKNYKILKIYKFSYCINWRKTKIQEIC